MGSDAEKMKPMSERLPDLKKTSASVADEIKKAIALVDAGDHFEPKKLQSADLRRIRVTVVALERDYPNDALHIDMRKLCQHIAWLETTNAPPTPAP